MRLLSFVFFGLFYFGNVVSGQVNSPVSGQPGNGSKAFFVPVSEILALDAATPAPSFIRIREEFKAGNKFKKESGSELPGNKFPAGEEGAIIPLNVTQSIHSNFQGIQLSESGSIPPDCMGGVSHTQICVLSNGRIKFYPKPGVCDAALVTSVTSNNGSVGNPVFSSTLRTFFSSVLGGSDVTDPHIYFDRLSGRWFVIAISVTNASNRIVIALSNGSEVTAQSSFSFYFFNHDNGAPTNSSDRGAFCDYPMFGLDKHALYIGGLIFNSSGNFIGSSVYVVNKATLISGGPLQFTAFRQVGLVNSGIFAPQGVYNDDPEATRGYFMGVDNEVFGRLRYIVVNNPGGTSPTITQATVNVPATYYPNDQPALGSTLPLDDLGDERLLAAQMMRNKITGQNAIWTAHHIAVNSAGTAVTEDGVAGARNAIRWYQLTDNNGTLSLTQSGSLFDNATTSPKGYWMGTIAGSGQGHALAGSSVAAPNLHANAVVAGRYSSQPLGILNPAVNATNFTAVYNRETSGEEQRWGDYSQTVVDPSDDMTFWTFQEYTTSTNNWGLRAVQLKAPPPATPTSVSAIICDVNRMATVTLTGQSNDFSGFFDPGAARGGPEYVKRLRVTSTGNVAVSNIELLSATQLRFVMNFSTATLGSQQTLTITNPDCQAVTFAYTLPANCTGTPSPTGIFAIDRNPVEGGEMTVTLPQAVGSLRMLAIDGKLIESFSVTNTTMRIKTDKYASGIYFLEFINNNKSEVLKVFISRQ